MKKLVTTLLFCSFFSAVYASNDLSSNNETVVVCEPIVLADNTQAMQCELIDLVTLQAVNQWIGIIN